MPLISEDEIKEIKRLIADLSLGVGGYREAQVKRIRHAIDSGALSEAQTAKAEAMVKTMTLPDPQPEPASEAVRERGFYCNSVILREMGHALPSHLKGHVYVTITDDGQYRYEAAADCEVVE